MRKDNKQATATSLNKFWDGEPLTRVRAQRRAITLRGKRASVHLMVQPDVAEELLKDYSLANRGLLGRFAMTRPPRLIGQRFYRKPPATAHDAVAAFQQRMRSILDQPFIYEPDSRNDLATRLLGWTYAAETVYARFHDEVEAALRDDEGFLEIAAFATRVRDMAIRIAGILTLFEDLTAREVDADRMDRGVRIARYFLGERLRLVDAAREDRRSHWAALLETWLVNAWACEHVSPADIQQFGPNALRNAERAWAALEALEARGRLVRVRGPVKIRGRVRRHVWRRVSEAGAHACESC